MDGKKEDLPAKPARRKVYNMEPRTPLKRQRIPVQRFQSPVSEEATPKPKMPTEERILLYKKGTFLAVRNPEGSFYLCKTMQNVYRSSRRFKIQWLNLDQDPNIYKLDYLDGTELECILADVKMERMARETYRLPYQQQIRAEKALQKALNVEQGLPPDEGVEEEEPKMKRRKVDSPPRQRQLKPRSKKDMSIAVKAKRKNDKTGIKANKRRAGTDERRRGPDKKLKPNPKIKILEKEPFFETKEPVPFISKSVHGKLAIRAVLQNDMSLLKSLISDDEHVYRLDCVRSVANRVTALHYAIQRQNKEAVKLLAEDQFKEDNERLKKVQPPTILIDSVGTGWYNPASLGIRHIRAIAMGRGNREGNNAFTKDLNINSLYNYTEYALMMGVSKEILEVLIAANTHESRDEQLSEIYRLIHKAIIRGHRKLAGRLIEEAEKAGGYGYNFLHKEVLLLEKDDLKTLLPASVKKRPFDSRITPIHCAAINPNVKYLQTLLSVEPDINIVDRWQRRPIHYAAACMGTGPLEYLLDRGANPMETDSSGMMALHYACTAGRAQNADFLLKRSKANAIAEPDIYVAKYGPGGINRPNRFSYCPLHIVVENGFTDVMKVLMKHQLDVNRPLSASKDKMTPLMIAAAKGHLHIARRLVEFGATVEQPDRMKRTALIHAVMNGNTHVASYLLYLGADPNRTDSSGNTAVHYASAYGWHFCLKLLINEGNADPNIASDWKVTPAGIAFLKGHIGLVDYLLSQPDADVNFRDERGMTLVSIAASSQLTLSLYEQLLYLVKEKGADCTIPDLNGFTPLHFLASNTVKTSTYNYEELMDLSERIAKFLVDYGCDPGAKTNDGMTPLMMAIEKINLKLVRFLVRKLDTVSNEKNKAGKNVLHLMAEICMIADFAPLLQGLVEQTQKVADNRKQLDTGDNARDALKLLVNEVDNEGYTALLRACQFYKNFSLKPDWKVNQAAIDKMWQQGRNFIRVLIEQAGADINATVQKKYFKDKPSLKEKDCYTKEGKWSAVHFMVAARHESPVKEGDKQISCPGLALLLQYKPMLDSKDLQDITPLIQAIRTDRTEAVERLLKINANANCVYKVEGSEENQELTPLLLVAPNGKPELLRMLVDAGARIDVSESVKHQTPLHLAVQNRENEGNSLKRAKILLLAGANVNAVDKQGLSALHHAVRSNTGQLDSSNDVEELLLERGANVLAKDKKGRLPLHYAFGDIDRNCTTSLDPIELCGLLTHMMEQKQIDEQDINGVTPLHRAACRGATICCRHLLQRHANIGGKDCHGNTPLSYAVKYRHDSCAIMLIQEGANVKENVVIPPPEERKDNHDNDRKKKPVWKWQPIRSIVKKVEKQEHPIFQEAISSELQNVAHMMLESEGMDYKSGIEAALCVSKYNVALRLMKRVRDSSKLQTLNQDGRNLFHILALHTVPGRDKELQLKVAAGLFDKGVSLSQPDKYGCTPIMFAALVHQPLQLGRFMLMNNSKLDVKHRDRFARNVMAAFFWNYELVKQNNGESRDWIHMLVSKGASLDILFDLPPPHHLLFGEQVGFQRKVYFKHYDGTLISPLIFAICSYNFKLVQFLLKTGASPNVPDEQGATPLMHAVTKNDIHIVKLLLNYDYSPQVDGSAKPQLTRKQSRRIFCIKPAAAQRLLSETNGDDTADEDEEEEAAAVDGEEDDDEEYVPEDDVEEDVVNDASDIEELEEEEEEMIDDDNDDHDTDEMEDEEDEAAQSKPKKLPIPRLNSKTSTLVKQGSMVSIKTNEFPFVEKTSAVNLASIDNHGSTVIHHLVCPLDYGTYDNEEILYVLAKAGAPLEVPDSAGLSPLNHALVSRAPRLARMLQKLIGVDKDKWEKPVFASLGDTDGNYSSLPKVDFASDAEYMIKQLVGADSSNPGDSSGEFEAVPDLNCNIRDTGEIVYDSRLIIPFDILLSKVDVGCGVWGMYNFYKMQIVRQKDKNIFVLFTRWGRIGDRGQFQHTPFQTLEEAVKEFSKIFKSKTGNDWLNVKNFENHQKKYRLVQTEERKKGKKQHKINYDLNSDLTSKLPFRLQDLIKELSSVKMLSAAFGRAGVDTDIMPFGRIKKEALLKAVEILHQLRCLVDTVEKQRGNLLSTNIEDYQSNCEKISKLSSDYFHLIPQHGYEYEKIRPIDEQRSLKGQMNTVSNLLDYEVASRILLGAQYRLKEMNPLDYIYQAIGCHIHLMNESDIDSQYILKYIYSSDPDVRVHAIYKLSRSGEKERIQKLNLDNHMLLWHGSSVPNFISILNRGLLIAPPEAPSTGQMFGEGIYSSDTFAKAASYCFSSPESSSKFILLCEVALGKMKTKEAGEDGLDASDTEHSSVVGVGREIPDSAFDVILEYGATLPLGPLISNPTAKSGLRHNEYIVYDPAQVCQRYLVQFSD